MMKQNGTVNDNIVWTPKNIIEISDTFKYALVILNTALEVDETYLKQLWEKAELRVTVDGGTDRWFNWAKQHNFTLHSKLPIPDYTTGDFDSIRKETLTYLEENQISKDRIIHTPDQLYTDFTKSLREINTIVSKEKLHIDGIVTVCENSGRIDHVLANINTLHKAEDVLPNTPVYIVARNSISWLLRPNVKHVIQIPEKFHKNDHWTSLIPFCGRTENINTTGLKWNLENGAMEFGSLVSTSNGYGSESEVTVQTPKHLLWAMGTLKD